MYKKILIATDGTELAGRALSHGLALAKSVGATVLIATVTELWSALEMVQKAEGQVRDPIGDYERMAAEYATGILEAAEQEAKKAGVACETRHISDRHPSDGIIEAASDGGCDLIVMSSHGRRGVNRLLLGSEAHEVLSHSKIPVLIVR